MRVLINARIITINAVRHECKSLISRTETCLSRGELSRAPRPDNEKVDRALESSAGRGRGDGGKGGRSVFYYFRHDFAARTREIKSDWARFYWTSLEGEGEERGRTCGQRSANVHGMYICRW
jgi:hypothetical protein